MANITSIYSCFWLSSLQNCGERWAGGMGILSCAALSLQMMRAAVGGSAGPWCLMIRKLVACNGAAMRFIMQNRRVRVGRERQRKHFWAPGRLMRGQLFVCIPRHLLPETLSELPSLMKFDIVEMTGAMTALSQDRVKEEAGGGVISYHTCALLLRCSKVRVWWKCWWFPSRQAIHHSAVIPQRRALSRIVTLADLNNCAALRHKHGLDLDLMEFKPCTVDRGWNHQACAPMAVPTLIPTAFLGLFFFLTQCYRCIVRSTQIILRFDSVSVNHLPLL